MDGESLEGGESVSVTFPDWTRIVIDSACRELRATMFIDSDSDILEVGPFEGTTEGCSSDDLRREDPVLSAIRETESWRIVASDQIELMGTTTLQLSRAGERHD